jgi:hypothetical protein
MNEEPTPIPMASPAFLMANIVARIVENGTLDLVVGFPFQNDKLSLPIPPGTQKRPET